MSPISRDPDARARQIAALRKGGAPPAPKGNQHRRTHGAYAQLVEGVLDARIDRIRLALTEDSPLSNAADDAMIHQLAELMHRRDQVSANLTAFGLFEKDGSERPAVALYLRFANAALDHAEAMGMTARSRARLGLDVVRAQGLVDLMANADTDDGDVVDP